MRLIHELRREHELIDAVVGSLGTFVERRLQGQAPAADGKRFLRFFRLFAGDFHHGREEDVLFAALVQQAELPGDRGPIANLQGDHHEMSRMLDDLAPLLAADLDPPERASRLSELAARYCRALWLHIDVENSVLFPESEERLRRIAILELPSREMSGEERAAREDGEALRETYPPRLDPLLIRGEECVICPHYGESCDGIEREWWSDAEWEEFPDRVG
ncbi:MAG TPA: hemerythrin domain-containing protein [Vicinamibacteria bacterium]|nr:hemerythrin domain-containing protein [Vicinamibacteria bacterium]